MMFIRHIYIYIYTLVGGFNPSEKILVSWGCYSQYMEKNDPNHQPTCVYIYIMVMFGFHMAKSE